MQLGKGATHRPLQILPMLMLFVIAFTNLPSSSDAKSEGPGGSPTCAREVPSGSTVNPALGEVLLPNSSLSDISAYPCTSAGFSYSTSGNIAYGYQTLSGSYYYTKYQDQWTVPPAPSSGNFGSPEGLALWDGLQGVGGDIVQPLLVYGCITSSDCLNGWRITGYALCCGLFE